MTVLNQADAIFLGADPVDAVYLGSEKVWPGEPPPGEPYRDAVLADNPVAYYRLGGTGTITDEKGGPNGTFTNAGNVQGQPSLLPSGEGESVQFPGTTNGGIQIPDTPVTRLGAGPLSMECWAQIASGVSSAYRTLLAAGIQTAFFLIPFISAATTVSSVHVMIGGTATTGAGIPISSEPASGVGHHFVATRSGLGANQTSLYVNGTLISSVTLSGTTANSAGFRIAHRPDADQRWIGRIQEVALYDYALTAQQVADHYAAAQ